MPFTRISLPEHRAEIWQDQISAILQAALVHTFSVPKNDCFQLFEPVSCRQRVINPTYLAGENDRRSDDFLLFHITAGKPRNSYQKQELYRYLADKLHAALGISPADVMVVVSFTQPEDWSFSQGEMFMPEGERLPADSQ
ncbi:tautomerase-like protein [Rahnella sp. BIGb0236]|uniref:tautomerase family protein n=1 Tax=Rahnella sp. BIGb0236 TaxID=2485117 RepID=UPI00105EEDD2|nr:tautomerase family protein [Rahnella sp. BIGb0236]TDS95832.1 tautomerase-like protein [Rahnella sp. BIGb0236]